MSTAYLWGLATLPLAALGIWVTWWLLGQAATRVIGALTYPKAHRWAPTRMAGLAAVVYAADRALVLTTDRAGIVLLWGNDREKYAWAASQLHRVVNTVSLSDLFRDRGES